MLPRMDPTVTAPRRDEVVSRLAAHRSELLNMGICSLALFGSVARDNASAQSDVDILVDLQPMSLFAIIRIEHYLADLLGRKVDLVPRDSLRPQLRPMIESEALLVI